ncbi:ABC transporter ATP-binding protein [Virgisporangium aurantiacum]|uniref:ABC transporter ATP-binding protein n=1 Tax=Virgisporangium aurantiacum TaxID=175570 RepID=A0A8J3Z5H4_9ACTN|nr:ABC transporter ATP-binding protein [Virgisporangium aurantiacum]GIJ55665.1 ABC transporter ATP-binding protein [Virgisporangium aurantiacum]
MSTLLSVERLMAGYGQARVLHGIDLHVDEGEVVVVLGANGAGKTTLMRAISGLIPSTGSIRIGGAEAGGRPRPEKVVAAGVSLVPQGRGTFAALTVLENLRIGAAVRRDTAGIKQDIEHWFEVFPVLHQREGQVAGTLSGGEQQMLAVARALMSRPKLLLCDEISLGLAPIVVADLFAVLGRINRESGTALLLVEQNAELALALASRVYLLEVGRVASSGAADEFRDNDAVRRAYLGY